MFNRETLPVLVSMASYDLERGCVFLQSKPIWNLSILSNLLGMKLKERSVFSSK
jgi:hypothetical protein